MFKKLILAVTLLAAVTAQAQNWKNHQQFVSNRIQAIVDAGSHVYQIVNNNVISYDKATGDIEMLSRSSGLTEAVVNQIYYNYDRHFLLIAYASSNIDILYDDGTVRNMPVLTNYVTTGDKQINDVTFHDGHIYLSTSFGFVVVNDESLEMEYYRRYGLNFRSIAFTLGRMNALVGDTLYTCSKAQPETFDDFHPILMVKNREKNSASKVVTINSAFIHPMNDSSMLMRISCANDSSYVKRITLHEGDSVEVKQYIRLTATNPVTSLQPSPTGWIMNDAYTSRTYYTLTANGATFRAINGAGTGIYSSCSTGDGTLWGLGANGLFNNAAPTTYYKVQGISLILPYWAAYNPQTGKLYMTNTAVTPLLSKDADTGGSNSAKLNAHTYDGQTWRTDGCVWADVNALKNSGGWQPLFNPREENTYYVGTWFSGVVKVKNDTVVNVYDERNSPVVAANNYYRGVRAYQFDSQGNLWLVQSDDYGTYQSTPAMVLPAEKVGLNNVTAADWYKYAMPGSTTVGTKFNSFAIGRDDVKVYTPGNWGSGTNYLIFWRGPLDGEQEFKKHTTMVDQTGALFSNGYYVTMAADSTGLVWVASSKFYCIDPTTAFGDILHVTRPVNSAGNYVLDGAGVEHIDIDSQNRKWVSTKSDGVYLLNADCTEILEHFTSENSAMPSNTVFSTCPMGDTGHVMIMTSLGVVEYMGDDDVTAEADGAVTLYPNPVRPDFTGLMTINGVAKGRRVRITSPSGEVLTEFVADSKVTWDVCDNMGNRVETGRYAIYVEQPDGTFTAQPQAEALVIK
ncbi:MAG: hypothetical protein IJT30_04260 [Muribaculaceae bacterium]|nr:hypothetical protein [Muribaculaceae bacterium]